jgi:hypothetical protein
MNRVSPIRGTRTSMILKETAGISGSFYRPPDGLTGADVLRGFFENTEPQDNSIDKRKTVFLIQR